ncbi:hypothetical protein D3C77_795440 [compost metagenome]
MPDVLQLSWRFSDWRRSGAAPPPEPWHLREPDNFPDIFYIGTRYPEFGTVS